MYTKSRFRLHVAATCAIFALIGCAGNPKPPPAVEQPAPLRPDPRLCAAIEPAPPVQGGIIQPVTQEQRDAVQAFLNGELDLWGWGKRGWSRAEMAKAALCK